MFRFVLILFIWFWRVNRLSSTIDDTSETLKYNFVYYQQPEFSIKNTNITFTIPKFDTIGLGKTDAIVQSGKAIAVICQADRVNRGVYDKGFEGTINLAFENFQDGASEGQRTALNLFANNLFFTANNSKVSSIKDNFGVGGMINLGIYSTSILNSDITNFYGIATISAGDTARTNPTENFIDPFRFQNITFFDILNTQNFDTFSATLELLNYFNWTLVGAVYVSDFYGYSQQAQYLTYSAEKSTPDFACQSLITFSVAEISIDPSSLGDFCNCINDINTIQVITLWMSTLAATTTIEYLRHNCNSADKWTFIVTNDFLPPNVYEKSIGILNNSLLIRDSGPWNYQQYIDDCETNSSEEAKKVVIPLIDKYYVEAYKCDPNRDSDLPECDTELQNRSDPCKCTFNEFNTDPYASRYLFSSDMVNSLAEAMGLIQNNCTFLDEQDLIFELLDKNLCEQTTFTPPDLSYALRFVNFTGLSGPINFPSDILIRSYKYYYLYSVNGTLSNENLVGVIGPDSISVDISKISFIDNKTPISEIVPQNPGINYAALAVFFGISIVEVILCFIVIAVHLIYFNHPVIRRNSPYVTLCIISGLTMLALGELIFCLEKTNGTCSVAMYFYRIGFLVTVMGLLVKNFRIYWIFSNRKATAVYIPEWKLILVIAVVTLIDFIFITVLVAIYGFYAVLHQSKYDKYYYYYMCGFQKKGVEDLFKYVIQITQTILVICNLILAWMTRKVNSNYGESRSLAAFSLIIFAAVVVFVPLSLLMADGVDAAVLINVTEVEFLTLIICSALTLLFFPKFYYIYKSETKKKDKKMNLTTITALVSILIVTSTTSSTLASSYESNSSGSEEGSCFYASSSSSELSSAKACKRALKEIEAQPSPQGIEFFESLARSIRAEAPLWFNSNTQSNVANLLAKDYGLYAVNVINALGSGVTYPDETSIPPRPFAAQYRSLALNKGVYWSNNSYAGVGYDFTLRNDEGEYLLIELVNDKYSSPLTSVRIKKNRRF